MISKELLSEVLKYEGTFQDYNTERIMDNDCPMSIYELAHKCKEWAYKNGYVFVVEQIFADYKTNILIQSKSGIKKLYFIDTEPEAIFKGCEWIREQNDN